MSEPEFFKEEYEGGTTEGWYATPGVWWFWQDDRKIPQGPFETCDMAREHYNGTHRALAAGRNVLLDADHIVSGDRRKDYGDARECQERVARMWSNILDIPISGEQVCLCMMGLKIVRECQGKKRDNIVDIAGYARVYELMSDK
jgi:hypothetical protein